MNKPRAARGSTTPAESGWLAVVNADDPDSTRRERRDELAAILETALDCIIIMDAGGCIREFNPAAERTFGYRREDVLGSVLAEKIIPPAFREMHRRGLARFVETGEGKMLNRRIEVQAMRADGSEFPAELTITAIRSGEQPVFTAYLRDLTEQKQLLEALEASRKRWQKFFEQAPQSVVIFAPDGTTVEVNAAYEKLFRITRAQVIGWNILRDETMIAAGAPPAMAAAFAGKVTVLPPRRFAWRTDSAQPAPEGETGRDYHSRLKSAEAGDSVSMQEKWIGALLYPVLDEHGRVLEVVCIHDDATESVRSGNEIRELNANLEQQVAERTAALHESQERFYKLFHANPAMMTLTRLRDQRLVDVNDAFCRASDHTRDGSLGRTLDDLGIWIDDVARAAFENSLTTLGSIRDMEVTFQSATGRKDHVLFSAEVIEMSGEPHMLTVALDLNARMRAEEVLREALANEKELSRLKSSFVSMVSHEFRTPLGIILSSSEIIDRYLDTLDPAERREQLDAIKDAVGRMTALMEQVLMFSRIETGELECRPQPLDLAAFCARLHDEMISATSHRCPIEFTAETSLAGAVADEKLLRHIFTNLLSNAVKYSSCDEPVRFTARRENGDAIFHVIDRGLGIPDLALDRLFTAFHRARNVADIPGTGLGLVIVRKCLDAHGGDIHFASIEDEGTTVRVTLPLFPNPEP